MKISSRYIERYLQKLIELGSSALTVKNYRSDLLAFEQWTNNEYSQSHLEQVTVQKIIHRYAQDLQDANYSAATIERKLCAIKGFLEYQKVDCRALAELVKEYKPQVERPPVWLTLRQLGKYLNEVGEVASDEDAAIVRFIINTGVTAGELCRLTWADVSYVETPGGRKRRFFLKVGAKGRVRELPLTQAATEPLITYGLEPVVAAFEKYKKKQLFAKEGKTLTPKMVHYLVDKYASEMDFSVSPQILRNTFCKRMAEADVPLQLLAKMVGVKPEAVRVYYCRPLAPEQLLEAAQKVAI